MLLAGVVQYVIDTAMKLIISNPYTWEAIPGRKAISKFSANIIISRKPDLKIHVL